jgi:hypothetical protein
VRTARLPILVVTASLVAGCTISTEPVVTPPTADEGGPSHAPGVATPAATPDLTAVALDAVFGTWRRTPARPSAELTGAAEDACRTEDAVGELPLVVVDARGEGELTLVFASPKAAAVCHAALSQAGEATADARPVAGYPDTPPDSEKLGLHDLEIVESGVGARTVLVGEVGPDVARVAAQFDDATWSNSTMGGGWYAIWWPGREPALTVAAVNRRSEAVDGFVPKP